MSGHGKSEWWSGCGLGHVAKSMGVGFWVGSAVEEVCVAGVFALGEEGASEPPHSGIKPMEEAGELGESSCPEVFPLNVAEFVKEGHFESVAGPCSVVRWKINCWLEDACNDGRVEIWVDSELNGGCDVELAEGFLEEIELRCWRGLLVPTLEGKEVVESSE